MENRKVVKVVRLGSQGKNHRETTSNQQLNAIVSKLSKSFYSNRKVEQGKTVNG